MSDPPRTYLPAAGRDWLLPFYDPFVKLMGGDAARRALIEQATLQPGQRILDIGCGTGTLAVLIKQLHPGVEVVGLDPDPKALLKAKRKAERAHVDIRFDRGFSDELPYSDTMFDRVFSSFMFHHLRKADKKKTLQEVLRALKPGGSLHLADFGARKAGSGGFLARVLHTSHRLQDNAEDRILSFLREAGFVDSKDVAHRIMLFMHVVYYRALAPATKTQTADAGNPQQAART